MFVNTWFFVCQLGDFFSLVSALFLLSDLTMQRYNIHIAVYECLAKKIQFFQNFFHDIWTPHLLCGHLVIWSFVKIEIGLVKIRHYNINILYLYYSDQWPRSRNWFWPKWPWPNDHNFLHKQVVSDIFLLLFGVESISYVILST